MFLNRIDHMLLIKHTTRFGVDNKIIENTDYLLLILINNNYFIKKLNEIVLLNNYFFT